MRTVEEIRARHLDMVRHAVKRPSMWGGNAFGTELLLRGLLEDLCYIDDRDEDWSGASARFLRGCRRVCGQLEFQELPFPDFVSEVASTYAEVAFNLGYLNPSRLLTGGEMSRLGVGLDRTFLSRDWDERELHERFGPPSHEVSGGDTTAAGYACSDRETKWVFFDLSRRLPGAEDWLPVPVVRDVRNDLTNRMVLLPFGNRLVEGAGGRRKRGKC